MKVKGTGYIIFVTISIMLLGSVMIFTNVLGHNEMNHTDHRLTTTTKKKQEHTTVVGDKILDSESGILVVNNEIKEINLKKYISISGYNIEYPYEYFNPAKINTSTLAFINNYDNNVFVKIELLSETNYYNQYNNGEISSFAKEDEEVGYSYEYKFLRGNGLFIKMTRCTHEVESNLEIIPMMNYMINSLSFS